MQHQLGLHCTARLRFPGLSPAVRVVARLPDPADLRQSQSGETAADGATVEYDVCELISCSYNSQCPAGQTCAPDGECRDECRADRDCIPGQAVLAAFAPTRARSPRPGARRDARERRRGRHVMRAQLRLRRRGAHLPQRHCEPTVPRRHRLRPADGPGGVCKDYICTCASQPDAGRDAAHDSTIPDVSTHDASTDAPHDVTINDSGLPDGYGKPCDLPSDCPPDLHCGARGVRLRMRCAGIDCPGGGSAASPTTCSTYACRSRRQQASRHLDVARRPRRVQGVCVERPVPERRLVRWPGGLHGGCCVSANDPPCDSHSPCILDTCVAATVTCTHMPVDTTGSTRTATATSHRLRGGRRLQ